MRSGDFTPVDGTVEVDKTFICKEPHVTKSKTARGGAHKMKVLTLIDRQTKRAKSIVVDDRKADTPVPILQASIDAETVAYTDEMVWYKRLNKFFAGHDFTRQGAGEYMRGIVRTDTV